MTRIESKMDALIERQDRYPTWKDVERLNAPLEARVSDLETADTERQREARTTRAQMIMAVIGAGLSLVVTLLAVVLTGR